MGSAVEGDWPAFLGDAMAAKYGGVGIGMEGANGGTQPCRPACSFTDPHNPGYNEDRFHAIRDNYMSHVTDALAHAAPVTGPVAAATGYIREAVTGPFVAALFVGGKHFGINLMRSRENPWMVGQTVRTVVSDIRVGNVLFNGTPGEGFPAIRSGVAAEVEAVVQQAEQRPGRQDVGQAAEARLPRRRRRVEAADQLGADEQQDGL